MRKWLGRATMIVSLGLASYLGLYVEDYVDATDWIDDTEQRFRSLSLQEGGAEIEIVIHHTATSDKITAKELCEITNNRFNLGCSYALSVHPNGLVVQMNEFSEHTPSVGGKNSKVISIALVGDYHKNELPDVMVDRLHQIKKAFTEYDKDHEDFKISGWSLHRDHRPTLCPGNKAAKKLIKEGIVE